MEINDELRELILVGASALELKKKALENGMITLRRSGLIKAAQARRHSKKFCAKPFYRGEVNMAGITLSELLQEDDRNGRKRSAFHHQ